MRNLLLRVPPLRWCALQCRLKERVQRQEAAWLYTQSILVALGNITISWAGIGLILNRFIEAHHTQLGKPIRKDLPRNFTAKLDYLENVERDPRWDSARLAQLRAMRLELAVLNNRRVNLTHGLLMRRGYGPDFTIHIAKERVDALERRDIPISGQDVVKFSAELSDIGGRLSAFFMPMLDR